MSDKTSTLKVGDVAPDFELVDQNGNSFKLSDRRGKSVVVVAFHPLAFTGTCDLQMQHYQRNLDKFKAAGAEVVSVSVDTRFSKKAWAESLGGIEFPLLSDFEPKGATGKAYGIYVADAGIDNRALFIVDKQGVIRYIDNQENRGATPNSDGMFAALAAL